jgi:hypothetical protein
MEVEIKVSEVLEYLAMCQTTHLKVLKSLESRIITSANADVKMEAREAMKEYFEWMTSHPEVLSFMLFNWAEQFESLKRGYNEEITNTGSESDSSKIYDREDVGIFK